MGTIRILTGDGGGGRGKISTRIYRDIEKDIGPLHKHFHFMVGTSANALNMAVLSDVGGGALMSAERLDDVYTKRVPDIFDRSVLRAARTVNGLVGDSKYDPQNLQSVVHDACNDTMLSEVQSRLMVTAYDIQNRKPVVFKSWEAAGMTSPLDGRLVYDASKDFMLSDVVMSSAAAPTYFPPHRIRSMDGELYHMIDGSVWANNPAQVALAEARRIFGDTHDFLIVSVGTGETERQINADKNSDWSTTGWLKNGLVSLLMDTPTSATDQQMRQEHNESYHRLQIDLRRHAPNKPAPNDDMDDGSPENIARLEERADEFLHKNRDYMAKLKMYFNYNALPNYQSLLEESIEAAEKRANNRDPIMSLPTHDQFMPAAP